MRVGPTVLKLEISSGHTHDSHVHNLHLTINYEQRPVDLGNFSVNCLQPYAAIGFQFFATVV